MKLNIRLFIVLIPLLIYSDQLFAQNKRLLVLGDSLSAAYNLRQEQGWVSLLQNAWQSRDVEVINAAISGETSSGGLARLPRLLSQHHPSHLYLELGANDGLQGYPVTKMKHNLAQMIELAQAQGVEVILQEMRIPTNFGPRYTRMFTETYSELGEQYDIQIVSFFLADIALKPELMQRDGLHPNADAQPQLAQWMDKQLWPLISE